MSVFAQLSRLAGGRRSVRGERGSTAVEYALIVGLVAIVLVGAVALLEAPFTAIIDAL